MFILTGFRLKEASKDAAVPLYAPVADLYLEELVKNADRAFYFDERPRAEARVVAKAIPKHRRARPHWRYSSDLML